MIEAQTGFRHRVEVWRDEFRVAVVGGVTPALVVRHDEDDVGLVRGVERDGEAESECDYQVFHRLLGRF